MTIEKRGNKYRIKQMVDGKVYTVTVDHKPKNKEAQLLISAQIQKCPKSIINMKLEDACKNYHNGI